MRVTSSLYGCWKDNVAEGVNPIKHFQSFSVVVENLNSRDDITNVSDEKEISGSVICQIREFFVFQVKKILKTFTKKGKQYRRIHVTARENFFTCDLYFKFQNI